MIKAAMVGLGWWGQHILSTVEGRNENLAITHGVDPRATELSELKAAHAIELLPSLDDVLGDSEVDAVLLATPHSFHEAQIVAAAEAGKHVFCEKPLALTRESAARVVAACNAAGVTLGVGHERRFEPAMRKIKQMVDAGELGTVLHVESSFSHDKLKNLSPDDWRAKDAESPAAAMTATGIHLTDAYLNMFGPIRRVFGQTAQRVMQAGGGDVTSVQFEFTNGMTGYFSSVLATPLFCRFRVFGDKAWVEAVDTSHPQEQTVTYLTVKTADGEQVTAEISPVDTVFANLDAFAKAAAGGAPYPITDQEKVDNIAVLEAVVASVESRQAVDVG